MNKPLASCVCVTYNRPKFLNELLHCFLAQDYENKELIIVNDQSDIKYVFKHPRVKIYNLEYRFSSLGAKREYSKSLINGDFMFNMDDDDIYYSNHISKLIDFHLNNHDSDIVANRKAIYSESNKGAIDWNLFVPFNGACIKKDYYMNNSFPLDISCGEDQVFVKKANVSYLDDDDLTFHYRWGLGVHHMSGMGGDGIESYGIVTKDTSIGEPKIIILNPGIPEEVKSYYR